jgi:hypothetical protein
MSTYRKSNPNGADRAADRATKRMGSFFQITCSSSSRGHAMRQSSLPGLRSSPGLGSFFQNTRSDSSPRHTMRQSSSPGLRSPPRMASFCKMLMAWVQPEMRNQKLETVMKTVLQ